jgi:NAD(P)-dependent dehydrogenase (short-subunit alcohol dehydrogenase family)
MPEKIPVDARTAYISGAASGIGRAMAQMLSARGCPVAIVDQDEAGLGRMAEALPGPVLARRLDVRNGQAQLTFADEVAQWAPAPLGLVFNNAGVTTTQSVAEGSAQDDEWVFEISFQGWSTACGPSCRSAQAGLGRGRQHLERIRASRDAISTVGYIHHGVAGGRSRILIGNDARLYDTLARLMPSRYNDVFAWLAARRS